ncbi:MAG TPA: Nif3-like dinuclear metal center hexameric protein, partial [Clostridia bacterium]|nr:Nif3-like dinuclear metal center hexameric protein [Clostridia bacterium]
MRISKIIKYLEYVAPTDKSTERDNVGLLIKGKDNIRRVMVCLDITKDAAEYAVSCKADLIITHHPFIY